MKGLTEAKSPCVFLSGGVDSMLVLDLAREQMSDISVYCFNQNFSKEQWSVVENLIKLWDLEVRSFPPCSSYIVPNGKTLAQVNEYNLGGVIIPILRDFIDGPRCTLTLDKTRLDFYPFEHDVVYVGSRREDVSFATGQPFNKPEIALGHITFKAPLWDWSSEQVMEEADKRKLPYAAGFYVAGDDELDTGSLVACSNCLQGHGKVFCPVEGQAIDAFEWDKEAALNNFRTKFRFHGETYA